MKGPFECKNLLKNKRVIAAAKGLGVELIERGHWFKSLADVAFAMRCQLSDAEWQQGIIAVYCHWNPQHHKCEYGLNTDAIMWSASQACCPEHWIRAATLAWEATK